MALTDKDKQLEGQQTKSEGSSSHIHVNEQNDSNFRFSDQKPVKLDILVEGRISELLVLKHDALHT